MRCASCKSQEENLIRLSRILLCRPCHTMAIKAREDLDATLERARASAYAWLEAKILSGDFASPTKEAT